MANPTLKEFSVAWLKYWAREYRAKAEHTKTVDPEEIKAFWPGGEKNRFRGRSAWNWAWGHMLRLQSTGRPLVVANPDAVRALQEAQRRAPIPVSCSDGKMRNVCPKSFVARAFLDGVKIDLERVNVARALASVGASSEDMMVLKLAPLATAKCYQFFLWVVTHADPGLPFDVDAVDLPEPPEWTAQMMDSDVEAISAAHIEIHRTREMFLTTLNPDSGRTSDLPIEGWVGAFAHERGVDSYHLLTRVSTGELFASAVSAALAVREARPAKDPDPVLPPPLQLA